jgi:pyruvate formate lyase activating enzyme
VDQPLIFDIKRYAINDGPGIRVSIFFKGCPLNCAWCHNPESISPRPQKMYTQSKCIGCGACLQSCPQQACELTANGIVTDSASCDACGCCARVCPTRATELAGRYYSPDELLEIIEKERPFFDQSGGGVTFSGGEPLAQADYLCEILDACGQRDIHRCVDTSGMVATDTLLHVARRTDLFLYDLKLMDAERHRQLTGADNRLILHNLRELLLTDAKVEIRIPLIRGVNEDPHSLQQLAEFVVALPRRPQRVSLLPYHDIAKHKYCKLGQSYQTGTMSTPTDSQLQRALDICRVSGLTAGIGG